MMKLPRSLGLLAAVLTLVGAAQAQQARPVPPPKPVTTERAPPPGTMPQKDDPKVGPAPLTTPAASAYLSDIAVKGGITIGGGSGVSGNWGSAINVSGSLGKIVGAGECLFEVTYNVQNLGPVSTGSFADLLVANSGAWWYSAIQPVPALGKGASKTVHTYLKLMPYSGSTISLKLDSGAQVSEKDESNNQVQLQATVNGPCQGS